MGCCSLDQAAQGPIQTVLVGLHLVGVIFDEVYVVLRLQMGTGKQDPKP